MSWRDNARRRGIDDCIDGKSKDWETLKLECEFWDRKGPKTQGGDNTVSGDKQVGLAHQVKHSGMPFFSLFG